MSDLSADEVRHRLAALADGPWAGGIAKARREFAPVDAIKVRAKAGQSIALHALELSTANKRKSRRLATILRAHFEDREGVSDALEMEKRRALDDALTLPQLYELAVQTGYLPAEAVRGPARALFMDLFWSPAAREFVEAYDYVAVPLLASRVEVLGFEPAVAPPPNERAALRFAAFLAHLREFYADEEIIDWLEFLDDFIDEEDEQDSLWEYLQGESPTGPASTGRRLAGCTRFVTSLASALYFLDEEEQGRFGLVHAYWLQKFFGYERVDGVYLKNDDLWDRGDSWAHTVETSPHLVSPGTSKPVARIMRRQFCDDIRVLRRTFEAVRRLSKAARGRKTVTM